MKKINLHDLKQLSQCKTSCMTIYWDMLSDSKLKGLTCDGMLLYSDMMNRLPLCLSNNWIDDQGECYIIYTQKYICQKFHWGKDKVIKLFQQLQQLNLIEIHKVGFKKPQHIYLTIWKDENEKLDIESKLDDKDLVDCAAPEDAKASTFSESKLEVVNSEVGKPDSNKRLDYNINSFNYLNNLNNYLSKSIKGSEIQWSDITTEDNQALIYFAQETIRQIEESTEDSFCFGKSVIMTQNAKQTIQQLTTKIMGQVIKRCQQIRTPIKNWCAYLFQCFKNAIATSQLEEIAENNCNQLLCKEDFKKDGVITRAIDSMEDAIINGNRRGVGFRFWYPDMQNKWLKEKYNVYLNGKLDCNLWDVDAKEAWENYLWQSDRNVYA